MAALVEELEENIVKGPLIEQNCLIPDTTARKL